MNQIDKLQSQIAALELQASELDESAADYYEQLYRLLSTAFFHAKDIIALQAPDVPLTVDKTLEASLLDANDVIKAQTIRLTILDDKLDEIRELTG